MIFVRHFLQESFMFLTDWRHSPYTNCNKETEQAGGRIFVKGLYQLLERKRGGDNRRKWGHSILFDSLRPHGLLPTRLFRPWGFPGKSTGVGCHCLLQGIFPTQGSNPGIPHGRQMLYRLSHQWSDNRRKAEENCRCGLEDTWSHRDFEWRAYIGVGDLRNRLQNFSVGLTRVHAQGVFPAQEWRVRGRTLVFKIYSEVWCRAKFHDLWSTR